MGENDHAAMDSRPAYRPLSLASGLRHSPFTQAAGPADPVTRKAKPMPTTTPFPWFDGRAEAAAPFYVSVLKNSWITSTRDGYGHPGRNPMETGMIPDVALLQQAHVQD
ncbi:hypothetical protein GALL_290300 [mine drainage metagenome]|uniref:PhnB-like domain-containing protein n=1 Tax=mine drainage metagenome TaxID=410659 RepID=A0A1J5RLR7_9ZZZZ